METWERACICYRISWRLRIIAEKQEEIIKSQIGTILGPRQKEPQHQETIILEKDVRNGWYHDGYFLANLIKTDDG